MKNLPSTAKKVISVVLTIGLIISMFSCMSGLSAFAIDNAAEGKAAVTPIVEKQAEKEEPVAPVEVKNEETHSHCMCGPNISAPAFIHGTHKNITFVGVTSAAEMKNASTGARWGNFYLLNDIEIATTITFMWETHICLNGNKIIAKTTALFRAGCGLSEVKQLTFCDCKGTGKIMQDPNSAQTASGTVVQLQNPDFDAEKGEYKKNFDVYFMGVEVDLTGSQGYSGLAISSYKKTGETAGGTGESNVYIVNSKFTGSSACRGQTGGLISMNGSGTVYCSNATMIGSKLQSTGQYAPNAGGIFYMQGTSTLKVYSGTYTMDKAWGNATNKNGVGGVIWADLDTTVDLDGGTFTTTTASANPNPQGGVVYSKGTLIIRENAVLNGSENYVAWGNVVCLISDKTNSEIHGAAQIHGGNAYKGGAIYKAGTGTLTIHADSKGKIPTIDVSKQGKTEAYGGGAIWIDKGTVNISDGIINGGNIAERASDAPVTANNGGTIYCAGGTNLNISGGTINGGSLKCDSHGGAIYALGANVSITGGTVNAGKFTLVDGKHSSGGAIYAIYNSETQPGSLTISGDAKINGAPENDNYYVENGGAIYTTCATSEISGNAQITGGPASNGGAIWVRRNLTINLSEDGFIKQGKDVTVYGADNKVRTTSGGAIFAGYDANITINGTGTIEGLLADNGAAIFATNASSKAAQITINGGTIIGGNATNGGAIYLNGSATLHPVLNVYGGTIDGGVASNNGGAIYSLHGNVTIGEDDKSTAVIKNGVAAVNAGNIFNFGTLTMNGGTVIDGELDKTDTKNGVNIFNGTSSTFTLTGGEITFTDLLADFTGVNSVSAYNKSTVTISGGSIKGACLTVQNFATDGKTTVNITGGKVDVLQLETATNPFADVNTAVNTVGLLTATKTVKVFGSVNYDAIDNDYSISTGDGFIVLVNKADKQLVEDAKNATVVSVENSLDISKLANLTDLEKEWLGYETGLQVKIDEAVAFRTMMKTTLKTVDNYGAGADKYLYVFSSGADLENIEDYTAKIVIKIGDVQREIAVDDAYKKVTYDDDGEELVVAAATDSTTDKIDYVYYGTLSLTKDNVTAHENDTLEYWAVLTIGGNDYEGAHKSGKLGALTIDNLLNAVEEVE